MTDFRALCAEMVNAWDSLPWQCDWKGNPVGPLAEVDDGPFERARAALAEPDDEGDPYTEILDYYAAMAAQHSGCAFHK